MLRGVQTTRTVYPRVCGGTELGRDRYLDIQGLSPRVRGNRPGDRNGPRAGRSIPACAGEPRSTSARLGWWGVYPRVCGGTPLPGGRCACPWGLSPRVRGNLLDNSFRRIGRRSIPACAGEPGPGRCARSSAGVYPRVCGGTMHAIVKTADGEGLSPRVRGNPHPGPDPPRAAGSIPACAGEPPIPVPISSCGTVYPRVCGGTFSDCLRDRVHQGLSPRVRGNPDLNARGDAS